MDIAVTDGRLSLDDHGYLSLVSGAEALRQRIVLHLRLWRGEWALDTDAGIPYYERVLGKQPLSVATAAISAAIRRIPGVSRIDDLKIEQSDDTRSLTLRLSVETDEGLIAVELEL